VVVLVIEDEPGIADFLRRGLESVGFVVDIAADGELGLLSAQRDEVELVILDLGLPGLPGEQVQRRLRAVRPALPVIVLTAKDAITDRVANLDAGADDYVVKPFSFAELLARIRVRLRRRTSRRRWCWRPVD
jgi:DNA-binding response OmpR family regulator